MRVIYMYHESDPMHGSVVPGSLPNPRDAFIGYKPLSITQRLPQDNISATALSGSLLAMRMPSATTANVHDMPSPKSQSQANNEKSRAFELLNDGVKLPAMETIFWCKVFEFKNTNHKQHLIKVSV